MAWAPATVDCFVPLSANARFCGECGRPVRVSALLPTIEQPPQMEQALGAFLEQSPSFPTTQRLDELRATEYARLDQQRHIYLVADACPVSVTEGPAVHMAQGGIQAWNVYPLPTETLRPGHDTVVKRPRVLHRSGGI